MCTNHKNNEFRRRFLKIFNQYSNAIVYFLGRDKAEEIYKTIGEYYDVNTTLIEIMASNKYSNEDKIKNEKIITNTKNIIYKHINSLDKTVKQDDLEIYSKLGYYKNKKIEELQCEILENDIKTKKLIYLGKVINNLKTDLINLQAKNLDCGKNIDDILNSESIIRTILYSSFTKENIVSYGEYTKNIINKLQSPIEISTTNNLWNELKIKYNNNNNASEFFSKTLFFMMNEAKKIKETIVNLATLNSVGIDIFKM